MPAVGMLRWARAWRVPRGKLGASSPRRSAVPVTFSSSRSSGQGNADPRSVKDTGEGGPPLVHFTRGPAGPAPPLASPRPSFGLAPFLPHSPPTHRLTLWWPPPSRPLPLSYNLLDGDATLPAIVFLHGLFGSKTNFNSLAKAMVQRTGRRVSFRVGRRLGGRGLKAEHSGPSFNHSGLASCW